MSEIVRTPTTYDYHVAVEMTDDQLAQEGGAWVAVTRPEILDKHSDAKLVPLIVFGSFSRGAEGLALEEEGDLPAYHYRRAYRQGMQLGTLATGLLYRDEIPLRHIYKGLRIWEEMNEMDKLPVLERGAYLEGLGQEGLAELQPETTDFIEGWSRDITPEPQLRHIVHLGFGALVSLTHQIHNALIEETIRKETETADWDTFPLQPSGE